MAEHIFFEKAKELFESVQFTWTEKALKKMKPIYVNKQLNCRIIARFWHSSIIVSLAKIFVLFLFYWYLLRHVPRHRFFHPYQKFYQHQKTKRSDWSYKGRLIHCVLIHVKVQNWLPTRCEHWPSEWVVWKPACKYLSYQRLNKCSSMIDTQKPLIWTLLFFLFNFFLILTESVCDDSNMVGHRTKSMINVRLKAFFMQLFCWLDKINTNWIEQQQQQQSDENVASMYVSEDA